MEKILISISPWEIIWSMWIWKGSPSLYETLKWYASNWYKVIHFMPLIKDNKLSNEIYLNRNNIIKENFQIYFLRSKLFYIFFSLSKIKYVWYIIFYPFALLFYYLEIKDFLQWKLYINKNTILYGHTSYGAILAYFLWKKFNIKNIGRYYWTFLNKDILQKKWFKNIIKYYLLSLDIFGHKIPNNIKIMADDWTRGNDVLSILWIKEFLFIKNGLIKKDKYINNFNSKSFNIVMASRIVWWKRIDIAINMMKRIVKMWYKDIKLHIFGNGPLFESLVAEINNDGVNDNIIFYGGIFGDKVLDYIYYSDIFLSTNDISNLSNALYQAIFYWKAILATDTWNTREYVINNHNWYTINSIEDLCEKVIDLYNYPNKLILFWKNSLELAKKKGFYMKLII